MSEKYKNLKVKELQELLQKNGIPHSGKKEDLIERLVKNDERKALEKLEKEFELDDDFDESKLDDLPPIDLDKPISHKESVLSDDDDDFLAITTPVKAPEPVKKVEVATKAVEEKVKEVVPSPVTASSSFKFTPIVYESKTATVTESTTKKAPNTNTKTKAKATVTTTKTTTVTQTKKAVTQVKDTKAAEDLAEKIRKEAEKKLERSKRFGIKLDEKEMKEIRAARFGTVSKPEEPAKKESKKVVEKKDSFQDTLKKRAERFGIPEKKVVAPPTKDNKKATTPIKQVTKKTPVKGKTPVIKKIAQNNISKVKAGRVQKPTAKPVNNNVKKVTLNNVSKNTVLNKKQNNVNKKLTEGAIAQKKKNIVNNRKVNILNNNLQPRQKSARMVAFTPNPAVKQQKQQQQPAKRQPSVSNTRNIAIQSPKRANNIGNGRTIVIADKPNTTPITNKSNNNNNKNRKRGRGPESNHYSKVKKRRN